jgi:hypothetical protein
MPRARILAHRPDRDAETMWRAREGRRGGGARGFVSYVLLWPRGVGVTPAGTGWTGRGRSSGATRTCMASCGAVLTLAVVVPVKVLTSGWHGTVAEPGNPA